MCWRPPAACVGVPPVPITVVPSHPVEYVGHCALMIPAVSTQSFGAASIRLASFSFRHGSRHDPQSPTPTGLLALTRPAPLATSHHRTARCLGSPPAHPFCSTRQMSPSHPIQSWVKVGLVALIVIDAPRSLLVVVVCTRFIPGSS